jgi:hypothetical protein
MKKPHVIAASVFARVRWRRPRHQHVARVHLAGRQRDGVNRLDRENEARRPC